MNCSLAPSLSSGGVTALDPSKLTPVMALLSRPESIFSDGYSSISTVWTCPSDPGSILISLSGFETRYSWIYLPTLVLAMFSSLALLLIVFVDSLRNLTSHPSLYTVKIYMYIHFLFVIY
jgi:hypothetical protein